MFGNFFSNFARMKERSVSRRKILIKHTEVSVRRETDKRKYTSLSPTIYTISFRERERRSSSYRAVTREHASTRVCRPPLQPRTSS